MPTHEEVKLTRQAERIKELEAERDEWFDCMAQNGETAIKLMDELEVAEKRVAELEAERDNLQAALTARAKSMLALRDKIVLITDHIEDEGDRAYFGSTNDADDLKEICEDLDTSAVGEADTKRETYYSKGKDAEYFERLPNKEFAWALTCAAQDLNDSDENVSAWMPVSAMLSSAADRISAAPVQPGDGWVKNSLYGFSLENARLLVEQYGGDETDMTVEFIADGHSGPGFYCWCTEYPEDGSTYLGPASEYSFLSALPAAPTKGGE